MRRAKTTANLTLLIVRSSNDGSQFTQCIQSNLTNKQKRNKQRQTKDYMLGWQAPHWDIDSCALDNLDGALDCQPFEIEKLKINGNFQ